MHIFVRCDTSCPESVNNIPYFNLQIAICAGWSCRNNISMELLALASENVSDGEELVMQ